MARTERERDEAKLRQALKDRPGWVKAIWLTPARRLGVSLVFIACGLWILLSALLDGDDFFGGRGSYPGFIAAPALLALFGIQAVEAVADMVRGRDSLPVFHRMGMWLDRRWPLVLLYVAAMIGVLVALRS